MLNPPKDVVGCNWVKTLVGFDWLKNPLVVLAEEDGNVLNAFCWPNVFVAGVDADENKPGNNFNKFRYCRNKGRGVYN